MSSHTRPPSYMDAVRRSVVMGTTTRRNRRERDSVTENGTVRGSEMVMTVLGMKETLHTAFCDIPGVRLRISSGQFWQDRGLLMSTTRKASSSCRHVGDSISTLSTAQS